MLKNIIINGKIPYLKQIKTLLWWAAMIAPWSIFLMPHEYKEFGEIGWNALIAVMLIRPLADILPEIKLLRTFVILRKEVGIFSALMIIGHFIGYSIVSGGFIAVLFAPETWNINNYLMWGMLGLFAALPPLLTSNSISIRFLKKNWKRIQRISYVFFIFGGIHIALLGKADAALWVGIFVILLMASKAKLAIRFAR